MYRVGDKVRGKVQYFDGKNYIVKMDGEQNGFVYYNNIDLHFVKDPEKQIGKEYEFVVKEIFPSDQNKKFELTRISIMLEELEKKLDLVSVDSEIEIKEFLKNRGGIEFTYEGFKVFVPYKLMSHSYISEDEDLSFLIGKKAKVLECEKVRFGYDIVASIKALEDDPFDSYSQKINVGDEVIGKIIIKEHYGIFVKLAPNVKALLHKNDYSDELIDDIDKFKIDDDLKVKIKSINEDKKQIDVTMLDLD